MSELKQKSEQFENVLDDLKDRWLLADAGNRGKAD